MKTNVASAARRRRNRAAQQGPSTYAKKCENELHRMLRNFLIALFFVSSVPQFHLRDTQGATHTAAEWGGHKAIVLYFITVDCPVGNSYVPAMNRLREAYAARGIGFYAVQADPSVAEAEVVRYARDYRYSFPLLLDPAQTLVRYTNATVTPQVAVLSPAGSLLYLGPVDNRVEDFGKQRPQATQSYVRDVLDAVLSGKTVGVASHKSIGCAIPRNAQ